MQIREERPGDAAAIRALTDAAFATAPRRGGNEADIVDTLRARGDLALSLVAAGGGRIVGHIAFSPVTVDGAGGGARNGWFGLGPVSVLPARQRQGIGSRLIRDGLDRIRAEGAAGCVLVGDPGYYGRFGFGSDGALTYGDVPAEFVQWLSFGDQTPRGAVQYSPAFEAP